MVSVHTQVLGAPGKPIDMVIVRENTECLVRLSACDTLTSSARIVTTRLTPFSMPQYIKSEKEYPADPSDPQQRGRYVIADRQISERASSRIGRMAFEVARMRGLERTANPSSSFWKGPPKVTIVHKSNVLSLSDGLFRESCRAVKESGEGKERFSGVDMEEQLVDSMVYKMFRDPE